MLTIRELLAIERKLWKNKKKHWNVF